MKYTNYLKYLKSNNIILFDHDYRVSYNNINNYYFRQQTGGGTTNIINNNKLFNLNKNELGKIINIALSPNPQYLISLH
jgi:hypothetical protein